MSFYTTKNDYFWGSLLKLQKYVRQYYSLVPYSEHEEDSANFEEGPIDFNNTLQLNVQRRIEITRLLYNKDKRG